MGCFRWARERVFLGGGSVMTKKGREGGREGEAADCRGNPSGGVALSGLTTAASVKCVCVCVWVRNTVYQRNKQAQEHLTNNHT